MVGGAIKAPKRDPLAQTKIGDNLSRWRKSQFVRNAEASCESGRRAADDGLDFSFGAAPAIRRAEALRNWRRRQRTAKSLHALSPLPVDLHTP